MRLRFIKMTTPFLLWLVIVLGQANMWAEGLKTDYKRRLTLFIWFHAILAVIFAPFSSWAFLLLAGMTLAYYQARSNYRETR